MIDPKRIEFLCQCAELSNDDWGEKVLGLLDAAYSCRLASPAFLDLLEKEIEAELIWAEEACTIVERTETREVTYKELVVND